MGRAFISKSAEVTTQVGSDDVFDLNPAGALIVWPPAGGEALDVVSADALDNDAAAGTMRKIAIEGLDANYAPKRSIYSLNGTTEVAIGTWAAINDAYGTQWGTGDTSSGQNEGAITIAAVAGGEVYGSILAERNRMRSSQYTVPAGKTLLVKSIFAHDIVGANNVVEGRMFYRPYGDVNWYSVAGFGGETQTVAEASQHLNVPLGEGFVIPPKAQIRLNVTAAAIGSAVAGWAGELVEGSTDLLVTTAS